MASAPQACAPHPPAWKPLGLKVEVLLFIPPGRETRPALSQGQACQGHTDLEPTAGLPSGQLERSKAVSVPGMSLGPASQEGHSGPDPSGHQPSQLCS